MPISIYTAQTRCFPISFSYAKGQDSHKTQKRRSSEQDKPIAEDVTLKEQLGGALNHTVSDKIPIDGSQQSITINPRNLSVEGVNGSKSAPIHPSKLNMDVYVSIYIYI